MSQAQKSSHEQWMHKAIELAHEAELLGEVPVGAIIVDENDCLIGQGFNQLITQHDATAHAEILAIRNAGLHQNNYRLTKTRLYVTLEPCMMCVGAMIHARIDQVIFGAYDHKTGMAGTQDNCFAKPYHNHQISIVDGVLQAQCSELLRSFFRRRRAEKKQLKMSLKS